MLSGSHWSLLLLPGRVRSFSRLVSLLSLSGGRESKAHRDKKPSCLCGRLCHACGVQRVPPQLSACFGRIPLVGALCPVLLFLDRETDLRPTEK